MNIEGNLRETLQQSFGLSFPDWVTKEKLIAALAQRVDELIAGNPDQLFSMLYRLDISERKIKQALAGDQDISKEIAVLIYERQSEKIISRKENKSTKADDDLAW
jgi:hypothetical protein